MNRNILLLLVAGAAAAVMACDRATPLQPGGEALVEPTASRVAGPELPFEDANAVYLVR